MSDFCDFVPDDPSCAPAVEEVEDVVDDTTGGATGDAGEIADEVDDEMKGDDKDMHMGKDEKMMDHDEKAMTWEKFDEKASEYFHPMEANLTYLGVAVGAVVEIVLHQFVWHETNASTLSQAASGTGNTDYYNLLHMVGNYGGLGIWGIASLTQLLATFGIMVGINMMVWGMLVPMGGLLIELAYLVLGFLAYDQFFKQSELATPNATAGAYMAAMEREMAMHTAEHVAGAFEIYHAMPSWVWGAYMASSDEDKQAWREDKEFLMMLKLTPEAVEDWDHEGEEKMEKMDDEKKPMDNLMVGPPSLRKVFKF